MHGSEAWEETKLESEGARIISHESRYNCPEREHLERQRIDLLATCMARVHVNNLSLTLLHDVCRKGWMSHHVGPSSASGITESMHFQSWPCFLFIHEL